MWSRKWKMPQWRSFRPVTYLLVGLLPSKVRLLSKVLLEAMYLLASYVLVNTSSPPARGDGTEGSRAESQPARSEVIRPGRSKVVTKGVFDDRGRVSARSIESVMSIVWVKVGLLPTNVLVEALLAT